MYLALLADGVKKEDIDDDGCYRFGDRNYISSKSVRVGRLRIPPVKIPQATKVVSQKQYRIPGGHEEISATIQDLVDAGVITPVTSAWNNPVWPVRKNDNSWRMTVDYRELNKHTPPLPVAVPDIITLIVIIQKHSGTWYASIDIANAFFSIPIAPECQEQFSFTWNGRQMTFRCLPQGYVHSPTICHRLVADHLTEVPVNPQIQVCHYIDDILIQGETQDMVQTQLDQIVAHLQSRGWEINPGKLQGPAQSVKFLGINWHEGNREVIPQVKQKIAEFAVPKNRKEAQRFIGLFGFWRQHIPHLSQILAPLYKVTRKKNAFEWNKLQQDAFDLAKEAIQHALGLWPVRDGDVDLNVSVQGPYVNWSLWQKQGRTKVPLGFWTKKLPDAGERYTPFDKQLLACYWALVDTEQLTLGHDVILRPEIPIMQWVLSSPKTHRIGHAQEASIIKWKWYIQDRARVGPKGVAMLHEQVAQAPSEEAESDYSVPIVQESPVKWGKPFDDLSVEDRKHVWFTDGSARYIGEKRHWKAVSYNPITQKLLSTTDEGKSSQFAELYAVYQVLKQELPGTCHIFTDSWSTANGLAVWLPTWHSHDWKLHSKELWAVDAKPNTVESTVMYWEISPEALAPCRATPGSAGLDLHSVNTITLKKGDITGVETGIGVQIPVGSFGLIAPRSGLALKGIQVLGGVIDSDYQGEIKVILLNSGESDLPMHKSDRVAQLLIMPVFSGEIQKGTAPTLLTVRGKKGFGSTDNPRARVWVQSPTNPPEQAEIIATGQDNTVLVMRPGQDSWDVVPADKCYLRE
ncbi:uncharacterized protein LOC144773858 [Lissotriton helveticus]